MLDRKLQAYSDYLKGVGSAAAHLDQSKVAEANELLMSARGRMAIFGRRTVVKRLAAFERAYAENKYMTDEAA